MNIIARYPIAIIVLLTAMFFIAVNSHSTIRQIPTAGLSEITGDEYEKWNITQSLIQTGSSNFYRVVKGTGINTSALEMVAGSDGRLEYFQDIPADRDTELKFSMQFLATQGTGQYSITAFDNSGKVLGVVGWVVTDDIPPETVNSKWNNVRYEFNYKGDWFSGVYNVQELMTRLLPNVQLINAAKYRVSVIVGKGQHVLLAELAKTRNLAKALKLTSEMGKKSMTIGETINIKTELENISKQAIDNINLEFCEPYAYGIVVNGSNHQKVTKLLPGEKKSIIWQVKAQRADIVNIGKPWKVSFTANGMQLAAEVAISVTDNRPGKIFYVMTEDLEAIDGAGYQKAWGNCNGWLEPQEIKIQMVDKAEKLNIIAGKYGAKWTHYIAWPIVKAAEWAGSISGKTDWQEAVKALELSVTTQAKLGHEYGIHMHADYDPYIPGNILSYDSQINGLWANHLRHGWAHSIAGVGSFEEYSSRTGSLYSYQRILDNLQKDSLNGQIITSRVGSFDFGAAPEDQAESIQAYKKVGLWGGSDADGNIEGITACDFGHEIYFTGTDNINNPMTDVTKSGIVEFRPTPRDFIKYDSQTEEELNSRTDRGVAYFTKNGAIKSGIHGIIGFTHAMFVMGDGQWQTTEGGQFQVIDDHFRYVKDNYVSKSLVVFATASELVKAYIDYYAPRPVALYGPVLKKSYFADEYKIQILGQDIPFDKSHIQKISIKYPLYFIDTAFKVSVLKNGQPIYSTWRLPTPTNDIEFEADDINAEYTLKIFHNPTLYNLSTKARLLKRGFKENILNFFTKSAMV